MSKFRQKMTARAPAFFIAAAMLWTGLWTGVVAVTPAHAMTIERIVSPGGIEAWLVEEQAIPMIVMKVAWEGGSRADPEDKAGVAHMVSGLLDEGAGPFGSQAFQARLDDLAIRLGFDADPDAFNATLQTLSENRREAFEMLRLAVTEPRFDSEPVERIRAQIRVTIARDDQDPDAIAARAWYRAALPDHEYARPSKGSAESIDRIGVGDLKSYAKKTLARDNMKIAVVGAIDAKTLGPLLDKTFGALPAKAEVPETPEASVSPEPSVEVIERPMPQSVVVFGLGGLKRQDPDFIPAYVMNYVLGGGGFSSRLMTEVREKRGLAYSVGTYLYPLHHAGLMIGQVATENARVAESLALIREELRRLADNGITAEELAAAKTYLTGSYPLNFDSNASIAGQLVGIQLENLGIDYVDRRNGLIEAVTLEDIRRVARRLIDPDRLIVTIVGEPAGIQSKMPEKPAE